MNNYLFTIIQFQFLIIVIYLFQNKSFIMHFGRNI